MGIGGLTHQNLTQIHLLSLNSHKFRNTPSKSFYSLDLVFYLGLEMPIIRIIMIFNKYFQN